MKLYSLIMSLFSFSFLIMAYEPFKQNIELQKTCPSSNACTITAIKKIEKKTDPSLWQKLLYFASKEQHFGYINYDVYSKDSKKHGNLSTLYVNKNSRRGGVGTMLFEYALQDLKEKGCEKAYWCSTDDAVPFYIKNGAAKRKKHKSWAANPMKIRLREHTFKEKFSKFVKHYGHHFHKNDLFE